MGLSRMRLAAKHDKAAGLEVINLAENGKEDLIQDFVSIGTSFCTQLYGQRRSRRNTERLIAELNHQGSE